MLAPTAEHGLKVIRKCRHVLAGGCGWCPAAMALVTGTLHRVASDAKRWRGDPLTATAASADGQAAVAEELAAANKDSITFGTAMPWQLRELGARLQLQRAKCLHAGVRLRANSSTMKHTIL